MFNRKFYFTLFICLFFSLNINAFLTGRVVPEKSTPEEILNRHCYFFFGLLTLDVKERIRAYDQEYRVVLWGVQWTSAINPFIRAVMDKGPYYAHYLNKILDLIIEHEIPAELIFIDEGYGCFELKGIFFKQDSVFEEPAYYSLKDIFFAFSRAKAIAQN